MKKGLTLFAVIATIEVVSYILNLAIVRFNIFGIQTKAIQLNVLGITFDKILAEHPLVAMAYINEFVSSIAFIVIIILALILAIKAKKYF